MSYILRISVRYLDPEPAFHGRRDGGEPEWPPSPLRLFQALVDAAASRWRGPQFVEYAKPALEWLQRYGSSEIVALPLHHVGVPFRIAVPNNDLDVWARPASKGQESKKQPNELKTMKTVQPTRIRISTGNRGDAIHYLSTLPPDGCPHLEFLKVAARSITHLGWGIDMVAADADVISEADAAKLPGHRWRVVPAGGVPLRAPKAGTLDDLIRKHKSFASRSAVERRIQARPAAMLLRCRRLPLADRAGVGDAWPTRRRVRDSPHHRGPGEGRERREEQVPSVPSRPAGGHRRRHGAECHRHRRPAASAGRT